MFLFLTVVQALVAAGLVGVILMQRSEGGGLGVGGNPNGMMSARGAADFLTRATKWLAVSFVVLSIVLAALAVESGTGDDITSTVDRDVTSSADPLAAPTQTPAGAGEAAPAATPATDPLDGNAE
ncbi:MAG: preprotein translocase subunit SecG [Sphingomonadaceae bacterium]|nr:preprotein translocase subunit SecG [Sphingomonadaceae bacterium]MCP5383945.1 preprotein translocase subunit SecG [Altererythrobacter sp.]MCP5390772.1 preprotein translocase subunit SecG [Sphingomonadaceae bacterium]MCP5394168.1 preprotein translocase subunit SecG [Sphingomonadaceae bacterium]